MDEAFKGARGITELVIFVLVLLAMPVTAAFPQIQYDSVLYWTAVVLFACLLLFQLCFLAPYRHAKRMEAAHAKAISDKQAEIDTLKPTNEASVAEAVARYLSELDSIEESAVDGFAGDCRIGALQKCGFSALNNEQAERFFQTVITRGRKHPLEDSDLSAFSAASGFPFRNIQETLIAASKAGHRLSDDSDLYVFLANLIRKAGKPLGPKPPSSAPDTSGTPPGSAS